MREVVEIYTPREGVSDDMLRIIERPVDDGDRVEAGQVVATLESSKTVFDIEAPCGGFLYLRGVIGDDMPTSGVVGIISREALDAPYDFDVQKGDGGDGKVEQPDSVRAELPAEKVTSAPNTQAAEIPLRLSRAAKACAKAAGIKLETLEGRGLVRARDLTSSQARGQMDGRDRGKTGDRIMIVGGGGHTKMCIDLIRGQNRFNMAGIASSNLKLGELVLGVPVISRDSVEELIELRRSGIQLAVNGVGAADNHSQRATVFERIIGAGFQMPAIIHPSAIVEPSAHIGAGTQIMAGAYIGSCARINDFCIVNAGSIVSHDCVVEEHVHIAPGAILAGHVRVGSGTLIGMGCQIFMRVRIGKNVIVPNGVTIDGDIAADSMFKNRERLRSIRSIHKLKGRHS